MEAGRQKKETKINDFSTPAIIHLKFYELANSLEFEMKT